MSRPQLVGSFKIYSEKKYKINIIEIVQTTIKLIYYKSCSLTLPRGVDMIKIKSSNQCFRYCASIICMSPLLLLALHTGELLDLARTDRLDLAWRH